MPEEPAPVRYRWWSVDYRSAVRLPDGSFVTVIAKPSGYPLVENYKRVLLPPSLDLLYDLTRYLRYRLVRAGSWIVYIAKGDLSQGGLARAEIIHSTPVPSRPAAREQVELLRKNLGSTGLEGIGEAEAADPS